ncbi:hypothetical protein ACFQL4_06980 [Halosimplex aquaticum]
MTLTFDAEASTSDIEFVEENITYCVSEYRTPATGNDALTPYVCTETLTDAPSDTPIRPTITTCGSGRNVYELIITHTLGRLLGYDIWSRPVSVMTPKILFGPAHAETPDATNVLATPGYTGDLYRSRFIERITLTLGYAQDPETAEEESESHGNLDSELLLTVERIRDHIRSHRQDIDDWKREVRDLGFPEYADAYDNIAVVEEDIAYLEETASIIEALAEGKTHDEVAAAEEELKAIVERLDTIAAWEETREGTDVQIHRNWTDTVWSEWTSE